MQTSTVDFLYIGPPKSGSSWLFELLRAHPDVYIPDAKDIYFFDRFYHKGWDWYQKHFEKAGSRAKGEICHDYLYSQEVCERIKKHLPNVKIIVMLRHPVDRAISHYRYSTMQGNVRGSLAEALEQNDNILECSRYSKYLPMYLETFGHDNVLILNFSLLKSHPELLVKQVFDYLGVDKTVNTFDVNRIVNKAMSPRNVALSKTVRYATVLARNLGMANFVGRVKRSGIKKLLYSQEQKKTQVKEGETRRLTQELQGEIEYWGYLVNLQNAA